jgi:hypothetical protein
MQVYVTAPSGQRKEKLEVRLAKWNALNVVSCAGVKNSWLNLKTDLGAV